MLAPLNAGSLDSRLARHDRDGQAAVFRIRILKCRNAGQQTQNCGGDDEQERF